ncbi:MAG TPA: gliding motility-associated C-terminal domain-containing protein, partial [Chitinophagales bacterium]|nr:gliding motility-associated C-terminal domain-containing protein [Chitinophagales bacterium]
YTWLSGIPGNTATVTQLPAGNAIVTVTDTNGCVVRDTAIISQPSEILVSVSKADISCFGANDGIAFVSSVSGGTPGSAEPYTFLWSDGNPPLNRDSVFGLGAGTVTVTVEDSIGCQITATVAIIEPADIVLSISKTDISCFGLTDAKAWVTATGGTPGFSYAWSNGTPAITPDTTKNLPAGLVSVTVTDSRSCTDSADITIVEPSQLTLSIRHTDVSCFGGNNGTAKVIAGGGTPAYSYSWSAGTAVTPNDSVRNLTAGQVCVTVTDSRLCTAAICDTVTQPATPLASFISKTDVSCFGGNDGTAKIIASGGTAGYTYSWSAGTPVVPGDSVRNLSAGQVKVTVTDANGCTKADSITLIQPADLVLTIVVDSNANCNGGTNGGLTVSLAGGTPTYSYVWSTSPVQQLLNTAQTSHSVAGLAVGSYTVTVTDANDCSRQITEDIGERPGPQLAASGGIVLDRPTCDRSDGSISLNVTTQDPPNSYVWSPNVGNGPVVSGLAEGTYNVTIADASTCDTVLSIELLDIPGPAVDFVKIKDSYCDDNDGRATAIVTGGTPAYQFTWADETSATISTDSIITGLVEGLYSLIVSDANACDTQINFNIVNIPSPVASISPASPQTVYEGQVTELIGTSNIPASSFRWTPSAGLNCTDCDTVSAAPLSTVTYTLIVTDTITQCTDTAIITIIVKDETNIFIPNVITPNGDGVNDLWNIADLLEVFPDNEVVVINRWGDEIFREKSYGSNNGKKWDGTYKDQKVPDGTYYYIIKLNNIGKTVTGPITIISEE